MTSFYEASTSGLNFDRFTDELLGESTKLRMKQTFWTAKQLFREKLGRREDAHLVAADADLDGNLQQFHRIQRSTRALLDALGQMQREFVDLSRLELDVAEHFTDCWEEKEHLRRVLQMTANSHAFSAKERQKALRPIARLYHELDEFYERAILDCEQTVEAIEKARLEYRGSLLWMKKCSETLDPDSRKSGASSLDDFRTVQNVVKANKRRLDQLKEDVAQKVDILHKARAQLFHECLADYSAALRQFAEAAGAEFAACAEQMDGLESYEIDVLKILNDPIGVVMENQRKEERERAEFGGGKDNRNIRGKERKGASGKPQQQQQKRAADSESNDESLIELDDVDEVTEVCEPVVDRVRELLRFDDDNEHPEQLLQLSDWPTEEGEEEDDEIFWAQPAAASAGVAGLNLLKHSTNELASLGLMGVHHPPFSTPTNMRRKHKGEEQPNREEIDRSAAGPSNTLDLLSELQSALSGSGCQFDDGGALEHRRQSLDSPLAFFDARQSPNDGANDGHRFDHIFGLDQGPSTSASSGPMDLRKMEAMADDPLKNNKMVDISAPVPKLAPPPDQPASNKIQRGPAAAATLEASDLLMATTESGQPLWLKEEAQRSVLLEEVDPEEGEALFGQK